VEEWEEQFFQLAAVLLVLREKEKAAETVRV
jgi:hypothetical protein